MIKTIVIFASLSLVLNIVSGIKIKEMLRMDKVYTTHKFKALFIPDTLSANGGCMLQHWPR